jgi:hypothetical protein
VKYSIKINNDNNLNMEEYMIIFIFSFEPNDATPAPVMPFLSTPSFDLSAGAEPALGQRPAPVPPSLPPAPAAAPVQARAAKILRVSPRPQGFLLPAPPNSNSLYCSVLQTAIVCCY